MCHVEIKLGLLRAACLIDVRIKTRIRFALQDDGFQRKKRVIQYGLLLLFHHAYFVPYPGSTPCISVSQWILIIFVVK